MFVPELVSVGGRGRYVSSKLPFARPVGATKAPKQGNEVENMRTRLLTLREVADYFHVHPGTVYRLVKNGKLRGLRVGRDFRFDSRVLDDFIVKGGTADSDSGKDK